jgi:Zinc-finger of RNA-polymerase I-specific TFIIB, Rrn7
MNHNEVVLLPCTKCNYNVYELIDGYYYCTECHEQYANKIVIETNEFEQTTEVRKSTITIKSTTGKERSEKNPYRRTSFEEYNFILYGLVNEILEIEDIPNFKLTVLQLWISYLKSMEVGFFDEMVAALPKFFAIHRRA